MPRGGALLLLVVAGHIIGCCIVVMGWIPTSSSQADLGDRLGILGIMSAVVAFFLGLGLLVTPTGGRRRVAGFTLLSGAGYGFFIALMMGCYLLSEQCPPYFKNRLKYYSLVDFTSGFGTLLLCTVIGYVLILGTKPLQQTPKE